MKAQATVAVRDATGTMIDVSTVPSCATSTGSVPRLRVCRSGLVAVRPALIITLASAWVFGFGLWSIASGVACFLTENDVEGTFFGLSPLFLGCIGAVVGLAMFRCGEKVDFAPLRREVLLFRDPMARRPESRIPFDDVALIQILPYQFRSTESGDYTCYELNLVVRSSSNDRIRLAGSADYLGVQVLSGRLSEVLGVPIVDHAQEWPDDGLMLPKSSSDSATPRL